MKHRTLVVLLLFLALPCFSADPEGIETQRHFLSGKDRKDAVDWGFRCSTGPRAGEWAKLPVPSNWELHGFGNYGYSIEAQEAVGEYRLPFALPEAFRKRRVFLVFEGAMTDTTARLNGTQAGPVHQGGFYRFKVEVTGLLKAEGENLLEVTVAQKSASEGVNRAERMGDYWNFGGIYRPVLLEAVPDQFIEHLAIDARADGSISIHAFVDGKGEGSSIAAQVYDGEGKPFGSAFSAPLFQSKALLRAQLPLPRAWSAEKPSLYTVELSLQADGKLLHRTRERFGFRTFEVRAGDGLYLNGRRIVLQGANRHSFRAESGRCLAEEDHRQDITLMKQMNMNAVRMSHYPPDKRFLELCDELGLYVLDELAGWQKAYDTAVGRKLVEEMVRRDVNHPSILFWDNGNEGGWNKELDGDFAKWDPQARPVLHPWEVLSGLNTAHYRVYDQVVSHAKGLTTPWSYKPGELTTKPEVPLVYMPTEFLHALFDGGAGAGLEDYWSLLRSSPYLGGGFIWALVDEGVKRHDTGSIDVKGNAAPDGILGPRREKEGSFFTIKELWCPVAPEQKSIPDSFDGKIELQNRFSFTDLSECRFAWELRRVPAPGYASCSEGKLASGSIPGPLVAPGEKGILSLPLPNDWREADVLALRADDPSGAELWTWTWPLPGIKRLARTVETQGSEPAPVSFQKGPEAIIVRSGNLALSFECANGRLGTVTLSGRQLSFGNGPRLVAGQAVLTRLDVRQEGPEVLLQVSYEGSLRSVSWRIRPNGWIDCSYAYTSEKAEPCLGVTFDYPADKVRSKTWVGGGPYRVWQNRLRGVSLGLWSTRYNDTITGWSGWEYPEFKGFFSGVRWLMLETTEGRITALPSSPDLFTQVLTPGLPPDALQRGTALKLPEAGLGFLHVIPAIGTKFNPPGQLGPQGQVPPPRELYKGRVSFRFDDK